MEETETIYVPADVPNGSINEYLNNYDEITLGSGRLMLFAGDQKIEHLNEDFYGEGIHEDDHEPEHLFKIANAAEIGVFAGQMGLISMYGRDYPDIPYLVKLNSKTNLVKTAQEDPLSAQLMDVEQVVEFKNNSGLNILAVGYTIYLGSKFEQIMLQEAAQAVYKAHQHGLVTVLWIYPRGAAVKDEKDPNLIAGATGVAACLGTDFVKVNAPKKEGMKSAEILKQAVLAAGKTKVICAGGSSTDPKAFLQSLRDQITIAGASGNATGRNIHQKSLEEAIRMCNAITAITIYDKPVDDAYKIYLGEG
ncbi:MAG: fructose-bisphosphate aldolase / 6-deoxy-5-ketofructose 1-phosphate synthase [Acidobacteriota bacterium]|nr:fructose-bisphosphate aldolase / 6-deoxy-5-ketofructose 1-phosphate synthase [Acidobacteriota bacterium]